MDKGFKHFIITRFNLKQSIWDRDKLGNAISNSKWLEQRFKLFETYCFPSLENQTNKNFEWLVYFDINTPEDYKLKNESFQKRFKNYKPIYVSSFKEFEYKVPFHVQDLAIADGVDYIITSRLDNDDAYHEDMVKTIHKHFIKQSNTIIDFVNGLALQISDENKLSLKCNKVSGPFISLIENVSQNKSVLTVYHKEHLHWLETSSYITVNDGYYWMQIIHDRNITNDLGNEITFNKKYLKGFYLPKPITFNFKYYVFIIFKKFGLMKIYKAIVK